MYMAYFMSKNPILKYVAIVMTFFCLFGSPIPVPADNEYEKIDERLLYSKACALMDGDSGRVLYEREGNLPLANASTTKILTCIVCLENADLSDIVTASKKAAAQPKVHLGMKTGEQFYVKDLLYAMMLESFNDCAMALAEHVGESMEGFSDMLNKKAKEIGCSDTFFITPNGLDAENETNFHHTTATDLCKIMKYCCWDSPVSDQFLAITQTANYSFSNLDGKSYHVSNKNAFLSMMKEAISGKTGFTSAAGYCYVAAIESEGRRYTIALLACGWPNHKTYKWNDSKILFHYGMEHYTKKEMEFPDEFQKILIVHGKKKDATLDDWGKPVFLSVYLKQEGEDTPYLLSQSEAFIYETEMPSKIFRCVEEGEMVGKVKCYLNEDCVEEKRICAESAYELWDFHALMRCFVECYFIKNYSEIFNKLG